jgi:hypothetical protein
MEFLSQCDRFRFAEIQYRLQASHARCIRRSLNCQKRLHPNVDRLQASGRVQQFCRHSRRQYDLVE